MRGKTNDSLKQQAIKLRKKGYSYPMIERELGVSKATQNGWFSGVALSSKAHRLIMERKRQNLVLQRKKASAALKERYINKLNIIYDKTKEEFGAVTLSDKHKELLLAALYLGEGFKSKSLVGLGNSHAEILLIFLKILRRVYSVGNGKLKCYLHLRNDQKDEREKKYWSRILSIPMDRFGKSQFDIRTINSKTWQHYHGVCSVYCYDANIGKRLQALMRVLLKKI